jgi:hypothetical protein
LISSRLGTSPFGSLPNTASFPLVENQGGTASSLICCLGFEDDQGLLDKRLKLDLNESVRKVMCFYNSFFSLQFVEHEPVLDTPSTTESASSHGPSAKAGEWSLEGALRFDNVRVFCFCLPVERDVPELFPELHE